MKDYKLLIEPRIYQTNIFKEILDKNSLVVLPTGLGKTIIALMLIIYHLRKYNKKIIFLAPTKPLAEQHKRTIINNSNISEEEVFVYTGEKAVEKRVKAFKEEKTKIIVGTPQTILNDYMKGLIDFKEVSLMIFDEAHRAVGNYDYVLIAKEFVKQNPEGQILALTASPGSNREKIKEMLNNLFIEKVEIRTYKSMDVKPYIKKIKTEWVSVELPSEYKIVSDKIKKIEKKYYEELKKEIDEIYEKGYTFILPQFSKLTKKDLLSLQEELKKAVTQIKESDVKEKIFKAIIYLNILIKLQYLIELLETQGKSSALDYAHKIVEEARAKTQKSSLELIRDEEFLKTIHLIEKISQEHPKLEKLYEIIEKEKKEGSKKFIVFTQFRNTAKLITDFLNSKGIKAERFVGKASREGDKGLSQKEQVKLIERFKNNEFEVLVATSVAEEGIDIPAVDAVIFYEPVPSEIRTIQRRGRTGRQEEGKVYVLITKDTVDMAYYFSAKKKERQMLEEIEELALLTKEIEIKSKKLKTTKKELKIIVDDRERNAKLLDLLNEKFEIQRERLDVGDFIISDRIVIERKTLEDFLASLLDKRIFEQIQKMKAAFEKPIIIVEGSLNIEDLFYLRNIHPNAIRGLLISILVDEGIPIIFTKNEEETVNFLEIMARREQITEKRLPQVKVVKKVRTISDAQEALIASIPGINRQLAINLLSYFKTPKKIANASITELMDVPLIGKEKAKKIFEIFNSSYDQNNILKEEKEKIKVEEKKEDEKAKNILEFLKAKKED